MKRAHALFHVSKLKPFHHRNDDTSNLNVIIDANGTEEQLVAEILAKKRENRRVYYLVRFDGDIPSEAIWKPKSELSNCMELVRDYEQLTGTSTSEGR